MTARSLTDRSFWGRCLAAGLWGGVALGAYLMMATLLNGPGFWWPMNLIGATVPALGPPGPMFAWGATLTGLGLHLFTSACWGLVYGAVLRWLVPAFGRTWSGATSMGIGYGLFVWVVMGLFLGPLLDPAMRLVPPVDFFIAHVAYGLVTAWVLKAWIRPAGTTVSFAPPEPARRRVER